MRSFVNLSLAAAGLLATLAAQDPEPPVRLLLRARGGGADRLDPLRYVGGFETKTLLYETLVRRGPDGRMAPALASRWQVSADGRAVHFELREGATFHDGSAVTAEAVQQHFRRWVGLPEHDWLPGNRRITDVSVDGPRAFTVHLDRPYALLADLSAINPCAIVGPSARDWEGEFTRPMGTGPFRFVAAADGGRRWRIVKADGDGPPLDVTFAPRGRDARPIDALLAGEIDAFVGGWDEDLPAERLDALAADERFVVATAQGSSVAYLSFRYDEGPTADVAVRRRIAAAIDRDALIADVEGGRATTCTAWAAPAVAFWPRGGVAPRAAVAASDSAPVTLRLAVGRAESRLARLADAVGRQLAAAGFVVERVDPELDAADEAPDDAVGTVVPADANSGEARARRGRAIRAAMERADVRVQATHGVPYDPHESLVARFGPRAGDHPDAPLPRSGVPPVLMRLVGRAMAEPDEAARVPIYAEIQAAMDREAFVVPLYSPHRVALHRRELTGIVLGIDCYRVDLTGLRWRER